MSQFNITDAGGTTRTFAAASGAGTSGDPFVQKVVLAAGTNAIGTVKVTDQVASTLRNGQVNVTNSAAALASSTALKFGVVVKFMSGTGPIYVGASGVTSSTGFKLKDVGDETPLIQLDNLATVFVVSANSSGDTACYIGA